MGVYSNKVSYYNFLKKTLKNEYEENYTSIFNKNFCFKNNGFVQNKKSKNKNQPINSFINWKKYLLDKLKTNKVKSWKYGLYNSILNDENKYINEFLYQNEIFFKEFSILNMPKSIAKLDIKNSQPENVLYPFDNDEIKKCSDNISFDMPNKNKNNNYSESNCINNTTSNTKKEISHHLTFTMKNESVESKLLNEPKYENKYNIYQIKKYCKIIMKHLKDEMHPINRIIKKFAEIFVPYLNYKTKKHKDEYEKNKEKIIKALQFFIEIMQVTLKLFYINSINYKFFISERDEFIIYFFPKNMEK